MRLQTYLENNGITHREFAEEIGTSQAAVTRYANGLRFPSRDILARIRTATGGRVSADDFMAEVA
jgi:transcriptional regulator with XRE-family HTH domain